MDSNQLKCATRALPDIKYDGRRWTSRRFQLRWRILGGDPREFLAWPVIRSAMFIGNGLGSSMDELMTLPINWHKIIKEEMFGAPEMMDDYTSGNLIRQAYNVF